jgi:hypothetical protein
MRKLLVLTTAVVAGALTWPCHAAGDCGDCEGEAEIGKLVGQVHELKSDISTVNLLNGLRLTTEQAEWVLTLAREAENVRKGGVLTGEETYRKALAEAVSACEAFKAEALKGEPPGGRISKQAARANGRLKELQEKRKKLVSEWLVKIDAGLEMVLDEGQLQIIESFKPCLIPPKDLRDPVRAGQAATEGPVKMLSRLRSVPAKVWNAHKNNVASKHIDRIEKHQFKMLSDKEREAEKRRLIALIEKARRMSDTTFQMEKTELAAELHPTNKIEALKGELKERAPRARVAKCSRAARWLLAPRVIPILEARLKLKTDSGQGTASARK